MQATTTLQTSAHLNSWRLFLESALHRQGQAADAPDTLAAPTPAAPIVAGGDWDIDALLTDARASGDAALAALAEQVDDLQWSYLHDTSTRIEATPTLAEELDALLATTVERASTCSEPTPPHRHYASVVTMDELDAVLMGTGAKH